MARAPRSKSLADQLRDLIEDQGLTNYELAARAKVSESMVWRFRNGADMKLSTAGRLAEVLGVDLVRTRRRSKPARSDRAASPDDQDIQSHDDTIV
jgi:transcriptional regulator with XRE-family HTH domain